MDDEKIRNFVTFARAVAEEETVWADWHNRVFGVEGKFIELFPTREERIQFFNSPYSVEVESISLSLREGRSIQEYTVPSK